MLVAQLCLTPYGSMEGSLSGSSVLGILQSEYYNELPFPSPGNLSYPGIEPRSPPLQTDAMLLQVNYQGYKSAYLIKS